MVNLPGGTTTISGQPFEQSRNDLPGAGVCASAGILLLWALAFWALALSESKKAARHMDKKMVLIIFSSPFDNAQIRTRPLLHV
jgi:hypothetical protein